MHAVFRTEPGDTLRHGSSGDSAMKQEVEDARVDGDAMVLGSIAEIERYFDRLARGQHGASSPAADERGPCVRKARNGQRKDKRPPGNLQPGREERRADSPGKSGLVLRPSIRLPYNRSASAVPNHVAARPRRSCPPRRAPPEECAGAHGRKRLPLVGRERAVRADETDGNEEPPGRAQVGALAKVVIGMTKTAAKELSAKGINVNAIAPGMIWTDMLKSMPPETIQQMDAMLPFIVPLNRKGSPRDVANLALFLASDESSFITGQIIFCDGGMKM